MLTQEGRKNVRKLCNAIGCSGLSKSLCLDSPEQCRIIQKIPLKLAEQILLERKKK
jgi:hypothetical protein